MIQPGRVGVLADADQTTGGDEPCTRHSIIRAWVFVLDEGGFVQSRRPFALPWEADTYALMLKDRYGLGDRVRYLRVRTNA